MKKRKARQKRRHIQRHVKHRRKQRRKGKKMPANVKCYFKYLNQGMSKAEARKKAGLPKTKKRRKSWGPGHPLYDWQHKRKSKRH